MRPCENSLLLCTVEGDGTKVYVSCLNFFDPVPAELAVRHEALLGAKALKAICFISHQPYMMTSSKVSWKGTF